ARAVRPRCAAGNEASRTRGRAVRCAAGRLSAVLFALLMVSFPQAGAQSVAAVTAIRMTSDPNHKMVGFPCQVNDDRRRYVCLIDSGATNTIVSDRVVRADGPVTEMRTGNGVVRVHQREVSLTIGDGLELKSKAFVQSMMLQ